QAEEALSVLEDALKLVLHSAERYYQAELYRLKGELLLKQTRGRAVAQAVGRGKTVVEAGPLFAQAEGCFNQSVEIAKQQNAKSLELRAMRSAARLYQNQ